jgi:hypothetical protein
MSDKSMRSRTFRYISNGGEYFYSVGINADGTQAQGNRGSRKPAGSQVGPARGDGTWQKWQLSSRPGAGDATLGEGREALQTLAAFLTDTERKLDPMNGDLA